MKPPTLEQIEKQLRALGCSTDTRTPKDKVYDSLVKLARKLKRPPLSCEVAADVNFSAHRANATLCAMVNLGRVYRVSCGRYVPVVKE